MRVLILTIALLFCVVDASHTQDTTEHYDDLFATLTNHGLSETEVHSLFSSSRIKMYPRIMRFFRRAKQSEKKSTYNVYDTFKTEQSVELGRAFLQEHFSFLQKTEAAFDVPKEVIVSLLRIETNFGRHTGSYQAFGVFVSIMRYADNPSRVEWAKDELNALIMLSDVHGLDPFSIQSSYAGAFGLPQFMPTSFVEFAEDGNGDGRIDLFNVEDAIWNIAKYLDEHGWHEDRWQAVYNYNHSSNFVEFVLWYAYCGLGTVDSISADEFKAMTRDMRVTQPNNKKRPLR